MKLNRMYRIFRMNTSEIILYILSILFNSGLSGQGDRS
jgi:hypothetical protein